jgi:CHRD domain-containing protein
MKQPGVLVLLVSFVLVISFVVASQEAKNDGFVTTTLSGGNEVNRLGDADGGGVLRFTVKSQGRQFCYDLSTSSITEATTATINAGDRSSNGNVVIALEAPVSGRSQGCVSGDIQTLADIAANPSHYYVNVTNAEFPNGAIRGQLK